MRHTQRPRSKIVGQSSSDKLTPDHSDWATLLAEAVNTPGVISQAYSRFWNYSVGNQILAMFQCMVRGIEPGPIHTFKGWLDLGRHVKKGERAITLCMPVKVKRKAKQQKPDSPSVARSDGTEQLVGADPAAATLIAKGITSTTYTDYSVVPGITYFYWVKARNPDGNSGFSANASGYAVNIGSQTPVTSGNPFLQRVVRRHEGDVPYIYPDSSGIPTVGVGYNLDAASATTFARVGLNLSALQQEWATTQAQWQASGLSWPAFAQLHPQQNVLTTDQDSELLQDYLNSFIEQLETLVSDFASLIVGAQIALIDVIYQQGSLSHFSQLVAYLQQPSPDYTEASQSLLDTTWINKKGITKSWSQVVGAQRADDDADLLESTGPAWSL